MTFVRLEVEGPVATLELDRPERHNSLIPELLGDLVDAHREAIGRGATVGVLAAAGPTFDYLLEGAPRHADQRAA